jgi:hypothetical protein
MRLALCGGVPGDVDVQRPVDRALRGHGPEAHEVGKHRQGAEARVHLVAGADLGVTVAVGGVGELEWDVGIAVDAVQPGAVLQQLGGELRADQAGQELAHDHVLVVPGGGSARLLEQHVLGRLVLAQAVDQPVVQLDEGDGHLAREQVHVVAWIRDERSPGDCGARRCPRRIAAAWPGPPSRTGTASRPARSRRCSQGWPSGCGSRGFGRRRRGASRASGQR